MEENGTKKTNSAMETTTLTRVPESERRPWWSLAFIWAGSVICIPALMVGSMVMAGMDFKQSCLCMVIGYVIVVFYMCLMGIQSSDLGLPCTVAISRAYGVRGSSFLVSLIIAISNIVLYIYILSFPWLASRLAPSNRHALEWGRDTARSFPAPALYDLFSSSRSVIFRRLIPNVDPLCSSAEVVGGSTPATPSAISVRLKPTMKR